MREGQPEGTLSQDAESRCEASPKGARQGRRATIAAVDSSLPKSERIPKTKAPEQKVEQTTDQAAAETLANDPKLALALKLLGSSYVSPRIGLTPLPVHLDEARVDRQSRRLLRALGLAVKLQRVQRGWSQEQLGSYSGLDRTSVGCIERGERNLGIANVALLARALELSSAELLAEAELLATQLEDDSA